MCIKICSIAILKIEMQFLRYSSIRGVHVAVFCQFFGQFFRTFFEAGNFWLLKNEGGFLRCERSSKLLLLRFLAIFCLSAFDLGL